MSRPGAAKLTLLALAAVAAAAAGLLLWGAWFWREDIRRTLLDPGQPFQTYDPPPAPDYARREAWALLPAQPSGWTTAEPPADVFFVHPTTYDGGGDWNAPIDKRNAAERLARVMLPNYAGPFARTGRVFAPRYRQASLYSFLTLRDDAREARAFAYTDVRDAFRRYLAQWNGGRPLIVAGVEQGGALAARLVDEELARDPSLRRRLAGVYLIETVVPADHHAAGAVLPGCAAREQAGCVVAYRAVAVSNDGAARRTLERALVWGENGMLQNLGDRTALCVNPVLGRATGELAPARLALGAANATGLEWGTRPAFLAHQVSARCAGGLLRVSRPESPSLRGGGGWRDRRGASPYNLFYADLEADAAARVRALRGRPDWRDPPPPVDGAIVVRDSPIHRIR